MRGEVGAPRLLPWAGAEGQPCYLVGDGTGHVAQLADEMESVQLEMAVDLLAHVERLATERRTTPEQLRYAVARLGESLREVHRIAVSRGAG
ncbi:hypothetical protein [Streptomyces catenulae]|uniref:ANTAR domain-containing protein n=1 Tax=Streptomyces catenulae TaxID=66875 RepID=A0ABV2Z3P3_9ACTN|nr:hypothetical protein [Streptomyces catenulae]